MLSLVLPALFPPDKAGDGAGERRREAAEEAAPTVVVQGIEAPLSTPAVWLCQQLACADTMLYVCVRPSLGDAEMPYQPA